MERTALFFAIPVVLLLAGSILAAEEELTWGTVKASLTDNNAPQGAAKLTVSRTRAGGHGSGRMLVGALLAAGLDGTAGSAVGPDGALFVTEGEAGRISRVDLATGEITPFASGLPRRIVPIGGVVDVAFIGQTAYALVTMVDDFFGGTDLSGIYRIDGPDSFTIIADLGTFSAANLPTNTHIVVPTGVMYALEPFQGDLLVTDGHHNRVLQVTLDGQITELIAFDNIVPTGLAVSDDTVYMAQAGAIPHAAADGKIVSFGPAGATAAEVAAGAPLLVDVEVGQGSTLFALSQGPWDGVAEGSPALPNTGALVAVNPDGTFSVIEDRLDRPTSFEVVGNTAYIVSLTGEIWTVNNLAGNSN